MADCSPAPTVDLSSRKALLQYLVRMGSFTSREKIESSDCADDDVDIPDKASWEEIEARCQAELAYHPPKIPRRFQKTYRSPLSEDDQPPIRVMQWNVLSQALSVGSDKFVNCPLDALSWSSRRWRLVEEIVSARPDILCLQEVDHFQFFQRILASLGFCGLFLAKPDSPSCYEVDNNGPDGCALFFDSGKFQLLEAKTRVLEVWGYQSNQVAIFCRLKRLQDGAEFCVSTTHLKARHGSLLATMRHEQGKDLLEFVKSHSLRRPVVLTGDFNANPDESVYRELMNVSESMDSAYRYRTSELTEPPYTTWKVREDGECCETIDYIFFSRDAFAVDALWLLPTAEDVGEDRVPSYSYPSDHFALVADLRLLQVPDSASDSINER